MECALGVFIFLKFVFFTDLVVPYRHPGSAPITGVKKMIKNTLFTVRLGNWQFAMHIRSDGEAVLLLATPGE